MPARGIVITKAAKPSGMMSTIPLMDLEEEQKFNQALVKELASILDFLYNLEHS